MSRAQGTVEYLLIIGIVIVLALVVVGLMANSTSSIDTVSKNTSIIQTASAPLSVQSTLLDSDGNIYLSIKNNTSSSITIKRVYAGANSVPFYEIVPNSAEKRFYVGESSCTAGESKSFEVSVDYVTSDGLVKKQTYPNALKLSCEQITSPPSISVPSCASGETIYRSSLCLTEVVGYWSFDSDYSDAGPYSNDGVDTGGVSLSSKSAVFDGSGYVDIAHDSSLDFGTGDFTISLWVKFGSSFGGGIIGKGLEDGWYMEYYGGYTYFRGNDNSEIGTISTDVGDDAWHLLTVSRLSGVTKFYLDGVEESSNSHTSDDNTSGVFEIGDYGSAGGWAYTGSIDDVLIFNKALTSEEINAIYSEGRSS